jgi:hypothetical protein
VTETRPIFESFDWLNGGDRLVLRLSTVSTTPSIRISTDYRIYVMMIDEAAMRSGMRIQRSIIISDQLTLHSDTPHA